MWMAMPWEQQLGAYSEAGWVRTSFQTGGGGNQHGFTEKAVKQTSALRAQWQWPGTDGEASRKSGWGHGQQETAYNSLDQQIPDNGICIPPVGEGCHRHAKGKT